VIGFAAVILSAVAILFPSPIFVLCIAPGDHVAVEDIDSMCRAPETPAASAWMELHHNFELGAAGKCRNCRDFFITPDERGLDLRSAFSSLAKSLAPESLSNPLSTDLPFPLRYDSDSISAATAPDACFRFAPLRC
jgi:hypothetical protein